MFLLSLVWPSNTAILHFRHGECNYLGTLRLRGDVNASKAFRASNGIFGTFTPGRLVISSVSVCLVTSCWMSRYALKARLFHPPPCEALRANRNAGH